MNILVFEGGLVAPSKLGEAQAWLSDNDADLRSTAPEGTTYMGVYSPIFSQSKYPTEVFLVYSVQSYGRLGSTGRRIWVTVWPTAERV